MCQSSAKAELSDPEGVLHKKDRGMVQGQNVWYNICFPLEEFLPCLYHLQLLPKKIRLLGYSQSMGL